MSIGPSRDIPQSLTAVEDFSNNPSGGVDVEDTDKPRIRVVCYRPQSLVRHPRQGSSRFLDECRHTGPLGVTRPYYGRMPQHCPVGTHGTRGRSSDTPGEIMWRW